MNYYQISQAELDGFFSDPRIIAVFIALAIWSLVWKGIALWKAARNTHKVWFVGLLIVNTLGILEIIYIFYFSRKKNNL